MGDSAHSDFPAALGRSQRKFKQWRQRHRPRAQIPQELWRQAAELACRYGINRIARALRLDYYTLKKRAAAAARSDGPAPEFVEILPGGMPATQPECMIEIEEASGAKLRIRLQGVGLADVAALSPLARMFRERR